MSRLRQHNLTTNGREVAAAQRERKDERQGPGRAFRRPRRPRRSRRRRFRSTVATSRRLAVTDPFLPRRARPLRSRQGARFLRRRLRRQHAQPQVARHPARRACKSCSISTIAAPIGADPKAGDGCGMLVQIPHDFFAHEAPKLGFALPEPGHYAIGQFFLPRDPRARAKVEAIIEEVVAEEGQMLLGWRDMPVDNPRPRRKRSRRSSLSTPGVHRARRATSTTRTISSAGSSSCARSSPTASMGSAARGSPSIIPSRCRRARSSTRACCSPASSAHYFRDLQDPRFETALALVHQRFSTNTFPSWPLAHPYRMVAHNGEINTLRGNRELDGGAPGIGRLAAVRRRHLASCGRSPTKASRTPPVSTMRSNFWCRAAIRSPTR